jgi:hypothetical protein
MSSIFLVRPLTQNRYYLIISFIIIIIIIIIIIMFIQPFVGPWPFFSSLILYTALRKPATYTQSNTNTE